MRQKDDMTTTCTLETSGATLTYDVRGDLPPADGRPPLLMVAQPTDASARCARGVELLKTSHG